MKLSERPTPRTDAAIVSAEYIRREMDYYQHKFVLADHARSLERRLSAAVEALEEAREDVASWGAYASDYFQQKWNLQGDLDRIDATLAEIKEPA